MQKPAQWARGALTVMLGLFLLLLAQDVQATADPACPVDNCGECEDSTLECTACAGVNFFLTGGTCLQCPSHCIQCSSNSTCGNTVHCDVCQDDYYYDDINNQCLPCPPTGPTAHCAKCSSPNICDECDPNWYPDRTCNVACPADCAVCASDGTCTTCDTTHYKNNAGNCPSCPSGCQVCADITGTCTQCMAGYYEPTSGTCLQCPGGCATCSKVVGKDLVLCDSCLDTTNYFFQWAGTGGTNPQCRQCPDGCATCSDIGDCLTCKSGFRETFSGSTRICTACVAECISCNSAQCLVCNSGYTGPSCTATSPVPVACDASMTGCSTCSGTDTTCTECMENYHLISDTCQACFYPTDTQCAECHRANIGYYWTTDDICERCPVDNCKTCAGGTCTDCFGGYNLTGNACVEINCAASNLNLLTLAECEMCVLPPNTAYWDTTTDRCQQCPSGLGTQTYESCERCGSAVWEPSCQDLTCTLPGSPPITDSHCTACNGLTLIGGTCTACSDMITDMTECTGCKNRFKDSCNYVNCDGNMEDPMRCTYCIGRKWIASSGECHSVNCNDINMLTSQEDCEACPGKHWDDTLSTPACQACSDYCLRCNSTLGCMECMDGHELIPGSPATCSAAPVNCYDMSTLTDAKCAACPGGKFSTGCTLYTEAECSAVTTDQAECTACRLYNYYWTGSACARCDVLDDEAKCTGCRSVRYSYTNARCEAAAYGDQEVGQLIPMPSVSLDTVDASPVSCLHMNRVYDATNSKCLAIRECNAVDVAMDTCVSCGFDNTTSCQACGVPNCAVCTTAGAAGCDKCKEGYKLVAGPACTAATCTLPITDVADCNACSGTWHNGANCITQNDATNCAGSDNEDQCHECSQFGFYWNGTMCNACGSSTNLHSSEGECKQCRLNQWSADTHTCKVRDYADQQTGWVGSEPETTCSGAPSDTNKCNFCTGRKWTVAGTCEVVNCHSLPTGMDDCDACPNMRWDSSDCKWCPDGCEECSSSTVCIRCNEGFIHQTDDTCKRATLLDDVCTNYEVVVGKEEENCNKCPGYWYNSTGPSCDFLTENDCAAVTTEQNMCRSCRIYGYVLNGTDCIRECQEGNDINENEVRCTKCRRVKWDGAGGVCKAARYTHPRDAMWHKGFGMPAMFPLTSYPMDAPSCQSAELYWQSTCRMYSDVLPTSVGCAMKISQMSKAQCDYCQDVMWNNTVCEALSGGDCSSSASMAVCEKCADWYWDTTTNPATPTCRSLPSGTCDDDVAHQSQDRCDECKKMGNFLWEHSVGTCKACSSSLVRRASCKSASCGNQWYSDSGTPTCMDGPDDCERCSEDGNTCMWCEDNKTWDGSNCVDCVLDSYTECDSCRHRNRTTSTAISYWMSNECYDCPTTPTADSCHRCSHDTNPNRYWNSGDGSCDPCGDGCASCTSNGCVSCMSGYFEGTPVSGHTPCNECGSDCVACTSNTVCTQCEATHCLDNGACRSRTDGGGTVLVQPGTRTCFLDASSILKVETCVSDHYLRRCDECDVANCMLCPVSSSTCTQCMSGYRLDSNGHCPSCYSDNTGCETCQNQPEVGDPFICTNCETEGYALETPSGGTGRVCTACTVPNCLTCPASKSVCTRCISTHYLTSAGTCTACNLAISNCVSCQDRPPNGTAVCLTCAPGYGKLSNECQACHGAGTNCAECQGAQICKVCNDGYVRVNGACYPGCHSCSGWECRDPRTPQNSEALEPCPGMLDDPPTAKCAIHTFRLTKEYRQVQPLAFWSIRRCERDLTKCMTCTDHGHSVTECAEKKDPEDENSDEKCCTEPACNYRHGSGVVAAPTLLTLVCAALIHLMVNPFSAG